MEDNTQRKKLRDTRLGQWLKGNVPDALDVVGDLLPDSGALGILKKVLDKGDPLSHEQHMELRRHEHELLVSQQENVTRRWEADMTSDVKLAKYIRPVILIALLTLYTTLAILDSIGTIAFEVKESYIDLLQILMLTAFGAYFAGRSIEKTRK